MADLPLFAFGAFGIAIVSLADTITISSAFGARTGHEVKANREMVGLGAADLAAGFFNGFPVSTSVIADGSRRRRGFAVAGDGSGRCRW